MFLKFMTLVCLAFGFPADASPKTHPIQSQALAPVVVFVQHAFGLAGPWVRRMTHEPQWAWAGAAPMPPQHVMFAKASKHSGNNGGNGNGSKPPNEISAFVEISHAAGTIHQLQLESVIYLTIEETLYNYPAQTNTFVLVAAPLSGLDHTSTARMDHRLGALRVPKPGVPGHYYLFGDSQARFVLAKVTAGTYSPEITKWLATARERAQSIDAKITADLEEPVTLVEFMPLVSRKHWSDFLPALRTAIHQHLTQGPVYFRLFPVGPLHYELLKADKPIEPEGRYKLSLHLNPRGDEH